ncbi:putative UTP-monosaccharide-1-phosphate uridylyltransferase [Helianthus anomalus]
MTRVMVVKVLYKEISPMTTYRFDSLEFQLDPLLRATCHADGDVNYETGYFSYHP